MPGMLVVTHGRLAEELVASARRLAGPIEALEAVSIGWDDDTQQAAERIRAAARRVDRGDGVVVLTDMFGGTPSNLALSLLEPGRVEIVTGANLAMIVRFANLRAEHDLAVVAVAVAREGRESIHVASAMLPRWRGEA